MSKTNDRAFEVMQELQKDNYQHIEELHSICEAQLNKVIKAKQYTFFADWNEEDYRSEVISRIWHERNDFDKNRGEFSTWFTMIAKTVYKKHLKKMENQVETVSMYMPNEEGEEVNIAEAQLATFSSETEVLSKEACKRIWDKLHTIPQNQGKAIELCRIKGYKPAEAAKMMGCKSSDISRWLNRGVEKIEEYVRKEAILTEFGRSA